MQIPNVNCPEEICAEMKELVTKYTPYQLQVLLFFSVHAIAWKTGQVGAQEINLQIDTNDGPFANEEKPPGPQLFLAKH